MYKVILINIVIISLFTYNHGKQQLLFPGGVWLHFRTISHNQWSFEPDPEPDDINPADELTDVVQENVDRHMGEVPPVVSHHIQPEPLATPLPSLSHAVSDNPPPHKAA